MKQYRFSVECATGKIPSFWSYRLYSWLLEELPREIGEGLHEQGETPLSQYLYFERETGKTIWVVNLLSEETERVFSPVLDEVQQVALHNEITLTLKKESCHTIAGAAQFITQSRRLSEERKRTELTFVTATAFKKEGRYEIFPSVRLLLQSLVNKWNVTYSAFPIDDADALEALERGLHIVDYQLRSVRYPLKTIKIPSFVGVVQIESRLSAPLEELWQMLLSFGVYSGVGVKTTLGMGGISYREKEKHS